MPFPFPPLYVCFNVLSLFIFTAKSLCVDLNLELNVTPTATEENDNLGVVEVPLTDAATATTTKTKTKTKIKMKTEALNFFLDHKVLTACLLAGCLLLLWHYKLKHALAAKPPPPGAPPEEGPLPGAPPAAPPTPPAKGPLALVKLTGRGFLSPILTLTEAARDLLRGHPPAAKEEPSMELQKTPEGGLRTLAQLLFAWARSMVSYAAGFPSQYHDGA